LSDLSATLTIYYLTPIYIIGILGNILNIIIFLRRNLRVNACSQYFIGLSMAQIILFNSFAIIQIVAYLIGYNLSQTMIVICKIRVYLYMVSLGLMRQFLCLISIDRWVVTTRNARIRKLSSLRVIRWLIIGSILFWLLYSIHVLIGYQISPTRSCTYLVDPSYGLFYSIQLTVSSILTLIIMVVFSILTFRNVRGSCRIQVVTQNTGNVTTAALVLPQNINRRRREIQLIKISLIQVISYVLLCMTASVFPLYSTLTLSQKKSSDQAAIDGFLITMSLLLLYTYNAVCLIIS
jgi:hypothetical protein